MSEPRIIRCLDGEAVAVRAAELFAEQVGDALEARGVAHVALAGGSTPKRSYELCSLPRWEGVELWFGDERCVGPESAQSNYRMVADTLLGHARGAVVHRMRGERGAEAGARSYERRLRAHMPVDVDGLPVFDVLHLGIGPDGHTASLFPNHPALDSGGALCLAVHDAPKPPPDRISLSLEVLRAARSCVLLVSGTEKARALAGALGAPTPAVPSSLLARETLTVIADADALAFVEA
jgi:6-phosphogluconolactonase